MTTQRQQEVIQWLNEQIGEATEKMAWCEFNVKKLEEYQKTIDIVTEILNTLNK